MQPINCLTNGQMTYKFKKTKTFDKKNLSHDRVHFSLKILQKTSHFHIDFLEACRTLDSRKAPESKIFHPGLVNLPSNFRKIAAFKWLPDFKFNGPSSFIFDLHVYILVLILKKTWNSCEQSCCGLVSPVLRGFFSGFSDFPTSVKSTLA